MLPELQASSIYYDHHSFCFLFMFNYLVTPGAGNTDCRCHPRFIVDGIFNPVVSYAWVPGAGEYDSYHVLPAACFENPTAAPSEDLSSLGACSQNFVSGHLAREWVCKGSR
jgi:hypothetical protein